MQIQAQWSWPVAINVAFYLGLVAVSLLFWAVLGVVVTDALGVGVSPE